MDFHYVNLLVRMDFRQASEVVQIAGKLHEFSSLEVYKCIKKISLIYKKTSASIFFLHLKANC